MVVCRKVLEYLLSYNVHLEFLYETTYPINDGHGFGGTGILFC